VLSGFVGAAQVADKINHLGLKRFGSQGSWAEVRVESRGACELTAGLTDGETTLQECTSL